MGLCNVGRAQPYVVQKSKTDSVPDRSIYTLVLFFVLVDSRPTPRIRRRGVSNRVPGAAFSLSSILEGLRSGGSGSTASWDGGREDAGRPYGTLPWKRRRRPKQSGFGGHGEWGYGGGGGASPSRQVQADALGIQAVSHRHRSRPRILGGPSTTTCPSRGARPTSALAWLRPDPGYSWSSAISEIMACPSPRCPTSATKSISCRPVGHDLCWLTAIDRLSLTRGGHTKIQIVLYFYICRSNSIILLCQVSVISCLCHKLYGSAGSGCDNNLHEKKKGCYTTESCWDGMILFRYQVLITMRYHVLIPSRYQTILARYQMIPIRYQAIVDTKNTYWPERST